MAEFIETATGTYNLAHIRKVRTRYYKETKRTRVTLEYADGTTETLDQDLAGDFMGLEQRSGPTIVPAAPGFMMLMFWFWEDVPPILDNVHKEPIIAWDVSKSTGKYWVDAVTLEEGPSWSEGRDAILQPDCVVISQEVGRWPSIEAWFETVREDWNKWKQDHDKKAGAA
jgi:hypothetical protein